MHFSSLEALKEQLIENFNDLITDPHKLEFGYIGPGHGSHGKQNWITVDEDVHDMYEQVWYVQLPKLATFVQRFLSFLATFSIHIRTTLVHIRRFWQ